jgi:exosortase
MQEQTSIQAAIPNPTSPAVPVIPAAASSDEVGILDEFQTELVKFWAALPNKGLFFGALAMWLLLFQFLGNSIMGYVKTPSLFAWMFQAYNSPNPVAEADRHGNLVPFLVLGLFWMKRRQLLGLQLRAWMPALILLIGAMALHVVGYFVQQPYFSIIALFAGIYAIMGLAWGPQFLYRSIFPFFLFMFCVPLGNRAEVITFPLRLFVTRLVEVIAHFFGIGVIRIGTGLSDPTGSYQYEVAAACSGIRSLFAIILFATVYGFTAFRTPWKRLFMMATAVPFAVLGNLIRMLCIILAAEIGGREAGNYVHEGGPMGLISLIPYVPAFVGILWLGGSRFLKEEKEKTVPV